MRGSLLIIITIAFANSVSGQSLQANRYFTEHAFKNFGTEKFGIEVSISPRIEFLHTLMLLAGNPHTNTEAVDYKIKILDKYGAFKNHPAIASFRQLVRKKFNSIDAPVFFFVRLTDQLELRNDIDNALYENDKEIRAMLEDLRSLAAEMDYVSFFNQNAPLFEASISTFSYNLLDFDEKNRLLDYYKSPDKSAFSFQIVLNLLGKGNFGPGLKTSKGEQLYAIISPGSSVGNLPAFDLNEVHYLVWHEFSHSFVNPLIDKHYDAFQRSEGLFSPIQSAMSAQGYADWRVTIKEHLVRAVTCRLAEQKNGSDFAEWNYTLTEIGKKYIYLDLMIAVLKQYEAGRIQTFEEAVVEIAQNLQKIDHTEATNLLTRVEEIRRPDVDKIPQIGEARKDMLLIVPKNALTETQKTIPWPGLEMNVFQDGWYYFQIEQTSSANVIFNNNAGAQTEDLLNISGVKYYAWDKKGWVAPVKGWNISALEKPNSVLVFFKPPPAWKNKPYVYFWNDKNQGGFSDYIQQYKSRFPNAQLISDEEAIARDLNGHDLVVWGNYENNLFLKKHYSELPVKFIENGFVADRTYKGEDLVLISGWLHPTDKERASELYITQSLETLINIDWVMRGGTNYHITRGLITLKSGNYTRRMKIWRF